MTFADIECFLLEHDVQLRVWYASARFVAAVYDYGGCEISRATARTFADAVMLAVGVPAEKMVGHEGKRVLH